MTKNDKQVDVPELRYIESVFVSSEAFNLYVTPSRIFIFGRL